MATRHRPQPGLVVREEILLPEEITHVGHVPVTTALRTAFDLARRLPLVEAVVAVDALSRVHDFVPADVLRFAHHHVGAHGRSRLPQVVRLADRRAGSPMETRIRLAILDDGLPPPVLQHPVGPYELDLAYPGIKLGIEYNGRVHLTQERSHSDLAREAYLGRLGWYVLRFRASDALNRPWWVATIVREHLVRAARSRGLTLAELPL